MIQANQLRIGNYVASDHFKDRDVIVKVRLIGQEQAIVQHPSGLSEPMLYQGEMRPIKLTKEILLKCGFIKLDKSDYFFIHGDQLNFKVSGDLSMVAWHNLAIHDVCIQHLHQLQNLYFALTGKELEIKF